LPSRSPDLFPSIIFFEDIKKNVMQTSAVAAAEILLQLVENGRTSVRSIPEIF
jgi:hypothetical protein